MQPVGVAALVLQLAVTVGMVIAVVVMVRLVAQQSTEDRGTCNHSGCGSGVIALVVAAVLIGRIVDRHDLAVIHLDLHAIVVRLVPPIAVGVAHLVLVGGDVSETALLQLVFRIAAHAAVYIDPLAGFLGEDRRGGHRDSGAEKCRFWQCGIHDEQLPYS